MVKGRRGTSTSPKGKLQVKGKEDVLVMLESIESDMLEERLVGEKEREVAVAKVLQVAKDISLGKFPPTPGEHKCAYCSFAVMCPEAYGDAPSFTHERLNNSVVVG